jgi:hypothetical protein
VQTIPIRHNRQPKIRLLHPLYNWAMSVARYIHWQDHGMWLGYFEEFPDYMTQGESLEQLQENLRDLYTDLASGEIAGIRRVAELTLG